MQGREANSTDRDGSDRSLLEAFSSTSLSASSCSSRRKQSTRIASDGVGVPGTMAKDRSNGFFFVDFFFGFPDNAITASLDIDIFKHFWLIIGSKKFSEGTYELEWKQKLRWVTWFVAEIKMNAIEVCLF